MTRAAPPTPAALVDDVARAYGLPPLRPVRRVGLWGDNERCVLEAADGRAFYLKERSHLLAAPEFRGHLLVHDHALRRGAPAVPLHATLDGDLVLSWRGRQFCLMSWVDGEPVAADRDGRVLLGDRLGALLRGLADMDRWPARAWDFPASRARWFPDHPSIVPGYLERLERPLSRGPVTAEAAAAGRRVRRHVTGLAAAVPWSSLPQQCVHGDPSPFHLLRSPSQGAAWIDFEDARWSFRCWDVARLCAVVGGLQRETEADPVHVRPAWAAGEVAAVLAGLEATAPLTAAERDALPSLLALACAVAAVSELDLDDGEFATPHDLEGSLLRLEHLCRSTADVVASAAGVGDP